jgi:hypothetical protein
VRLVVNTPTPRSGVVRDAVEIRLAATGEGILCLTAIETAIAAAEALDPAIGRPHLGRAAARRVGPRTRRAASARDGAGRAGRRGLGPPDRVTDRHDLVIFDCDGVLVDSERLSIRLDVELLRELGWPLTEDEVVERWVGRTDAAMRAEIEAHLGRSVETEWTAFSDRYVRAFAVELKPVDGIAAAVDAIQAAGFATCVASSGDRREDPPEPRDDRAVRSLRRPDLLRRRRRARQAGARSVPPRGRGDERRTALDGRRRGQRLRRRRGPRGGDGGVRLRRRRDPAALAGSTRHDMRTCRCSIRPSSGQ